MCSMKVSDPHDNGGEMNPKVKMPAPADELLGFVPYVPNKKLTDEIAMVVSKNYIRLSGIALVALGMPEYINVFLDYTKRRMMIVPGSENDKNVIKMSVMPKSDQRNIISACGLHKEIRIMTGRNDIRQMHCIGHKVDAGKPTIVFHLDDLEGRDR